MTSFMTRSSTVLLLVLLSTTISTPSVTHVAASPLQFHDFRTAYLRDQSPRALQTSGGNLPDLIAPTSNCFTQGGLQFACMIHQRVGTTEDYVDLNATVVCELGVAQFDFRQSNGCSCSVLITPSNETKIPKTCPCYVCPEGFGSSSLSIDCSMYLPSDMPSMAPSMEGDTDGATGDQTMPPTTASRTELPTASDSNSTTTAPTMITTTTMGPTIVGTTSSTSVTSDDNATLASAGPTPAATVVSPFLTQAPTASQSVASRRFLQEDNATTTTMAPSAIADDDDDDDLMTNMTNTTTDDDDDFTNETMPDPFIFATCVTIDCAGNCNGTCSLGCDVSGEQCAFCEGGAGRPTPSPTGQGGNDIETLSSGGSVSIRMMGLLTALLAAAATVAVVV